MAFPSALLRDARFLLPAAGVGILRRVIGGSATGTGQRLRMRRYKSHVATVRHAHDWERGIATHSGRRPCRRLGIDRAACWPPTRVERRQAARIAAIASAVADARGSPSDWAGRWLRTERFLPDRRPSGPSPDTTRRCGQWPTGQRLAIMSNVNYDLLAGTRLLVVDSTSSSPRSRWAPTSRPGARRGRRASGSPTREWLPRAQILYIRPESAPRHPGRRGSNAGAKRASVPKARRESVAGRSGDWLRQLRGAMTTRTGTVLGRVKVGDVLVTDGGPGRRGVRGSRGSRDLPDHIEQIREDVPVGERVANGIRTRPLQWPADS